MNMKLITSWSSESFQVDIPEIYQIELSNKCNLSCPNCVRQNVSRPEGFMDPKLVSLMINRGDFDGSYFVELQMYGEPLLSPHLFNIIRLFRQSTNTKYINLGLSTNGVLIKEKLLELCMLDYLTISFDSAIKSRYEELRPGSSYEELIENIDLLMKGYYFVDLRRARRPKIDLQVINYKEDELPALVELANRKHWDVVCRAVPDCFAAYQGREFEDTRKTLCLNPYLSVSVHWNGDVCPCCFSSGEDIIYGNLYDHTLRYIWKMSESHKVLQESMRLNFNLDNMPCKNCYLRSPVLFHQKMLMQEMKRC